MRDCWDAPLYKCPAGWWGGRDGWGGGTPRDNQGDMDPEQRKRGSQACQKETSIHRSREETKETARKQAEKRHDDKNWGEVRDACIVKKECAKQAASGRKEPAPP